MSAWCVAAPRRCSTTLEPLGEQSLAVFGQPDAGIWEYRGRTAVHTFSAAVCWAAADRLARIAAGSA